MSEKFLFPNEESISFPDNVGESDYFFNQLIKIAFYKDFNVIYGHLVLFTEMTL